MPVSVAPAVQRSVTDSETFSGRIEAAEFVELRPGVPGIVDKGHFADGADVNRGQLLFTVDLAATWYTSTVQRGLHG